MGRKPKREHLSSSESQNRSQTGIEEINKLFKSSSETVNLSEIFNVFQSANRETIDSNIDSNSFQQILKKIMNKINKSRDAIVKASYISALKELIINFDSVKDLFAINSMIDDLILLINSETSHIVIAEILNTFHKMDKKFEINNEQKQNIIKSSKKFLQISSSHLVKNECLLLLVDFAPISPDSVQNSCDLAASYIQTECIAIIKLLRDFSHYHDSRVRSTALSCVVSFDNFSLNSIILLIISLINSCDFTKEVFSWI